MRKIDCPKDFEGKWFPAAIGADTTKWTKAKLASLKYKSDKSDYWQLPSETFERGAGDCEDLCIAWLHSRLKAGVEPERLSLLICQCGDGFHALGEAYNGNTRLFYECRARRSIWRERKVLPSDCKPWYKLQLNGDCYAYKRVIWL